MYVNCMTVTSEQCINGGVNYNDPCRLRECANEF